MGAWGVGPFDNDEALDWLGTGLRDLASLRATLRGRGRSDESRMAAAAVVAAALGRPDPDLPEAAARWVEAHRSEVTAELAAQAGAAVEAVRSGTDLAARWRTAPKAGEWKAAVDGLYARLVDVPRERFVREECLRRVDGRETGLQQTVLVAAVKGAARERFPDLSPRDVLDGLAALEARGLVRLSAGRWLRK